MLVSKVLSRTWGKKKNVSTIGYKKTDRPTHFIKTEKINMYKC